VKLVWEVYGSSGVGIATFAYPDKGDAEAKAAQLSRSSGKPHKLRAARVPME
jgi:hypothetical protein